MNAEVLLGGKTRFAILEALTEAKWPVTAYQIAMTKGLDPAATYRCLVEFSELGVVESEIKKKRNQTFYKLSKGAGKAAAEYMRSLKKMKKQKASDESIDLEKWLSPEMQAERMAKIVRFEPDTSSPSSEKADAERKGVDELLSMRVSGELAALVASSQIAFNELFEEKKDGTFILKA
jgi:predicted ArsR family transcriptional regulator